MKIKLLVSLTLFLIISTVSSVFSNSIDSVTDRSARFWINQARYASLDAADIVAYNPAGTALVQEGLYFDLSSQTFIMPYRQKIEGTAADGSFEQNKPVFSIPNFFTVYNLGRQGIGNLAFFVDSGVVAGGGALEWDGTSGLSAYGASGKVKASASTFAAGGGAAYSFFDNMLSFSAGARYIYSTKEVKVDALGIDYKFDATGYTLVFGADIRPVDKLNIGAKYETRTKLTYKYDNNAKPDERYDLPEILSIGAEYTLTPKLSISASGVLYFLGRTDMEGYEDYFGTTIDTAIGADYKTDHSWKFGGSISYVKSGAKSKLFKDDSQLFTVSANPPLDWYIISCGATRTINQNLDITASLALIHYLSKNVTTNAGYNVEYEKDIYIVAVGAGYKI